MGISLVLMVVVSMTTVSGTNGADSKDQPVYSVVVVLMVVVSMTTVSGTNGADSKDQPVYSVVVVTDDEIISSSPLSRLPEVSRSNPLVVVAVKGSVDMSP